MTSTPTVGLFSTYCQFTPTVVIIIITRAILSYYSSFCHHFFTVESYTLKIITYIID